MATIGTNERDANPLRGVRLGVMERALLRRAPRPDAARPMLLVAADPSVRWNLQRAAMKLERVGLLERTKVRDYLLVPDRRLEGLEHRDGRVCRRREAVRLHAVRRTAVWLTELGDEIVALHGSELMFGKPIRWDTPGVARALRLAEGVTRLGVAETRAEEVLDFEDELREDALERLYEATSRVSVGPDASRTDDEQLTEEWQREHWRNAVTVAAAAENASDGETIHQAAGVLFSTLVPHDLAQMAERMRQATGAAPAASRAGEFSAQLAVAFMSREGAARCEPSR